MTDLTLRKIALVKDLLDYDHAFISPEGVEHFTKPFGFKGTTYKAKDTRDQIKGLNLGSAKEAEGQDADVVAEQIARHLGLKPFPKYGRGARLRECCRVILEHLEEQQKDETLVCELLSGVNKEVSKQLKK